MLSFFLTTKCNLCCRYCYNAEERELVEQTIDLEIAKHAIDWYFSSNSSRHIRFYGPGEPTQEFEKMKKITEYAKNHPNGGDRVIVEIQTNGVFTEEVRDWILNNVNLVWMSFDGTKDIQNWNRPISKKFQKIFLDKTSADVLEENVKWLIENTNNRNLMVGARVTITEKNIEKQKDLVNYFYALGIRHVWTDPLFLSVGQKAVSELPRKQRNFYFDMDKYVSEYLEAYRYAKGRGLFWGSFLAVNFDGKSEYHCRCCTPLEAPHITTDGYVSACDMALLGENAYHMDCFIVAKWNEEIHEFDWDKDKIRTLRERKSTLMPSCQKCPVKLHCGGCCLGETMNEFGNLLDHNPEKCNAIRRLYKEIGECDPYPYLHP